MKNRRISDFKSFNENRNVDDFPMSEKEFTDFIEDRLGGNSETDIEDELPEELYTELPDNYKKIYIDKMFEYGIYITQSKNKSLINDLKTIDEKKFEEKVLNYTKHFIDDIEHYAEYYNENMSEYFSVDFIESIDEVLQGRIIQRIIMGLEEGTATIDKDLYNAFDSNIQRIIKAHRLKSEEISGSNKTGIAPEMFIMDWM